MNWTTWTAFVTLTTILCLTPGPTVLLVLTEAMTHGLRKANWATFGIIAANTIYFVLSAVGVTALLLTFGNLIAIIQWIGTAYLVWLGLTEIFGKPKQLAVDGSVPAVSDAHTFRKGLILQLSNPGSIIFFSAVLPQFMDIHQPILWQAIILTVTCNILEFLALFFYAVAGSRFARLFTSPNFSWWMTKISGVLLIAIALAIALSR